MNLLTSQSSLPPSLHLCQNFLMRVDFPEKMASIYFLHFHHIEYRCRTNEPCTRAIDGKGEKYMLPEHRALLYLFSDMGHSRILPSHSFSSLRSQVKWHLLWGLSLDVNQTFAQPHLPQRTLCSYYLRGITPTWNDHAYWLYICYVFPSLTSSEL